MVLGALLCLAGVTGSSEGLKASQAKSRKEEHRTRKNNLIVHCLKSSQYSQSLEGRRVVLSGDKVGGDGPVSKHLYRKADTPSKQLYIDTGTDIDVPFGHPFEGYYLAYPDGGYPGLVSTITDEAPIMNWIYMNAYTYEMKFGNRQWAAGHIAGPFDCTRQERRLNLAGYEGFVAVQEGPFWSLYFDWDGDQLKSRVPEGTPVVEIDLLRRELRAAKTPLNLLMQVGAIGVQASKEDDAQRQTAEEKKEKAEKAEKHGDCENLPDAPEVD